MKVKLTTDWGDHKKGNSIEIKDKSVLLRGFETGLFEGKKPKELDEEEVTEEETK